MDILAVKSFTSPGGNTIVLIISNSVKDDMIDYNWADIKFYAIVNTPEYKGELHITSDTVRSDRINRQYIDNAIDDFNEMYGKEYYTE